MKNNNANKYNKLEGDEKGIAELANTIDPDYNNTDLGILNNFLYFVNILTS